MDRREFGRAALAVARRRGRWPGRSPTTRQPPETVGQAGTQPLARDRGGRVAGRLGVAVLDTATGDLAGHRLDERFPMCSTFKVLAAALVLARVDAGQERLDRRLVVARESLLEWAPVTSQHVGGAGMTMAELCEAAITRQRQHGGQPAAGQRRRPRGGDGVRAPHRRRRDAPRPHRADAQRGAPGDPRDTSTPRAMAQTLRTVMLGDALSDAGRAAAGAWMTANTHRARSRLRAGVPPDWRVADKTGTGRLRHDQRHRRAVAAGRARRWWWWATSPSARRRPTRARPRWQAWRAA